MPPHHTKLIINPNADVGNAWRRASDLRPVVEAHGGADWTGTVYPTHATELAHQAAEEGYERIIAIGGDGTVHEVINGLMQVPAGRRPKLGIVPVGTGNDFAHNAGIERVPELAMQRAMTGTPKAIDIALVEDGHGRREYWDNTLGIGFDAIINLRSRKIPLLRGFLVYLVAVFQTILLNHDAPRMSIKTDQAEWEQELLMIVLCNGPREGGAFLVAPEARIDDGWLHYASIENVSRPMLIRIVPEVMRGTHGRFSAVSLGRFRDFSLRADRPLHIHTDGEVFAGFGTDVRELKVEILPGAVELLT